ATRAHCRGSAAKALFHFCDAEKASTLPGRDGVAQQLLDLQSLIDVRKSCIDSVPVVQRIERGFPNPNASLCNQGSSFRGAASNCQTLPVADNYLAISGNRSGMDRTHFGLVGLKCFK